MARNKKYKCILFRRKSPLFNEPLKKKEIIKNIKNLLKKTFEKSENLEINFFIKEHEKPITCLKILETVEKSSLFFNEILNYFLKGYKKTTNRLQKKLKNKIINIFEKERKEIHNIYNVTYYFNESQISKIMKVFKIYLYK